MHKNRIILLAICFALLIVTVCGNERTRTDAKSVAHPLSLSPGLLRPKGSPQTVRVRLIEVETNADLIDSPVADSEITIKAGASSLSQKTNKNGVAVFDRVPCGQEIVITVKNGEGGEDGVFHRRLTCARAQVDLGVIEQSFGGKYTLTQRKTEYIGYDPIKNVWRNAAGKIVPNSVIRRRLKQR